MAGLPGWRALRLAPDRGVKVLASVVVAADPVEHVTFPGELIERGLILRGGEAVTGNPGVGGTLLEDAGKPWAGGGGVAVHQHRMVALRGELVEGGLIVRGGQAVSGLPGGRRGGLDPQRRVQRCRAAVAADIHQLHAVVADIVVEGFLVLLRGQAVRAIQPPTAISGGMLSR